MKEIFAWKSISCALLCFFAINETAHAEPYLAVRQGLKCSTCHMAASGGGQRTTYGSAFAQTELPARTLDMGQLWTGDIGRYFAVGGDIRGGWNRLDVAGRTSISDTEFEEFLAYIQIKPLPNYLTLYVDAKLRPDDPEIRE
ncbi:MAG: hypothetical protein OEN22_08790, partial [Gammaproteobacteria bacterium]|nr:hypothetical protein [Gammaproteobacteria bacterium]